MKKQPARRLVFDTLTDAVAEARHLHEVGYRQTGQWDLTAILRHCDVWLKAMFEEPVPTPLFFRPVFWIFRKTIGPGKLNTIIRQERMDPGIPTAPHTVFADNSIAKDPTPSRHADESRAIEEISETVQRFEAHQGSYIDSPFFGSMDRDRADSLHRIHLAHHLGYLVIRPHQG